ncbi:MAG: DNA repair protein RecN [Tissierellia bacterium]|nr:DNA repair protein RecN [Tissierellia bacterium]
MLLELNIENFAIIEEMKIEFSNGLNIITGETGSGKSIIIDSLGIVLGARATKDIIKTGQDHCYIEAIFSNYDKNLTDRLYEMGIEAGDLLVISREIRRDKPSITRINGRAVTASSLEKITPFLIDIFAQHETVSLMDNQNQKKLLDSFGDKEHFKNLYAIRKKWSQLTQLMDQFSEKSTLEHHREREIDLLKYQLEEIEEAGLTEEDESSLEEQYERMENITDSLDFLSQILNLLKSSYDSFNIEDSLDKSISLLQSLLKYNSDLNASFEELEDIRFRLKDVINALERYYENLEFDPERFHFLEERINVVNRLKTKYGNSIEEIWEFHDTISKRLDFLENYEKNLAKLQEEIDQMKEETLLIAQKITRARKEVAVFLEKRLGEEIHQLEIKNAKFKVQLSQKEIGPDGKDGVEFLLSSNIGEDFRPLSKIASGGEMSRMMLGFKSIIAEKDDIPTLVFDEIDSGISGKTAQVVGNKIKNLASDRQIIVISHLPQIVSLADAHFVIEKSSDGTSTTSKIYKLTQEERVKELARLIGGMTVTEAALQAAREMIF